MKNNLKVFSGFGLISSFLFIIFSFISRILFPFGDEPDFTVRAPRVIFGEHPFWSPYYIFHDILSKLNPISLCKIDAFPTSFWFYIGSDCIESIEQILIRLFITILIVLPLLYAITFRKSFVTIMKFFKFKLTIEEWNSRLDTLCITILFPSILYYLGIFAEEQFTLLLSLFIFLFWGSLLLISIIIFLIMSIDLGNSIVVLTFVLFSYSFIFLSRKINLKFSILCMIGVVLFAFIIGFSFLTYIENISFLASKAEAMYNKGLKFENKYPVILRPIVTFMTSIFMTPSGIKITLLYLFYGPILIWIIYKINILRKKFNSKDFNKKYILFFSVCTTILFFVFLFPDYSFGKYYVFMIPFILNISLDIFIKFRMFQFILFTNSIMFFHLLLYRI